MNEDPVSATEEAKQQAVSLVFTLLGAAGMAVITMLQADPAMWQRTKMRAARWAKRASIRVADASLKISDQADAWYENSRG